ncbi:DsbC family protein [Pseudomonas ovata]|uniref:DsbC family protein n=1 Tax=Pseudomonas ovata TaxID=1839709 RepID=UPI000D68F0FE|nr:DsbC family protein [Pseudomonas ovata]
MTSIPSSFSVFVESQVLTVVHLDQGVRRTLCVAQIRPPYSFQVHDRSIKFMTSIRGYSHHLEILAPGGTDPAELLTLIRAALHQDLLERKERSKIRRYRIFSWTAGIIGVVFLANSFMPLIFPADRMGFYTGPNHESYLSATQSRPDVAQDKPANGVILGGPQTALPVQARNDMPTAPAADGWPLPAPIRAGLPEKLRLAADRQLFTIQYSSGHARTLYVFADPECPNCQRLEPALNAAAGQYNVVVFPVAVIGKEKSIASVAPVLCLPFEQRKAAWDALFDKTGDVMNLGKAKPAPKDAGEQAGKPEDCDVARQALGVNEVAYQTYRIPGTPWVIADDGRYVSQAVLQDPALLQAFLQGSEVIDADK